MNQPTLLLHVLKLHHEWCCRCPHKVCDKNLANKHCDQMPRCNDRVSRPSSLFLSFQASLQGRIKRSDERANCGCGRSGSFDDITQRGEFSANGQKVAGSSTSSLPFSGHAAGKSRRGRHPQDTPPGFPAEQAQKKKPSRAQRVLGEETRDRTTRQLF